MEEDGTAVANNKQSAFEAEANCKREVIEPMLVLPLGFTLGRFSQGYLGSLVIR